jgi:glycosyltransferase involved in cell wall biosynthesis
MPQTDTAVPNRRLAYLVSMMPALSEAFILREIEQLRMRGFDIRVASINRPDRPRDRMTAAEAREASAAYCVKGHGVRGALLAHAATLLRSPLAWLRGLASALTLAGPDLKRIALWLAYFTEALMIGRWLRATGASHLHVHFASAASSVALLVNRSFGTRFSMTVHGPDEFYDARGQCLREKVAGAAFVVCISHFARSQLMLLSDPRHWPRLEVSRLGVDPTRFKPEPRERTGPFEVLCVGRLVPAKGQQVLLDAVARLIAQGRDLRLTLVGAGPQSDELGQQVRALGIEDRVELVGGISQDHIAAYYRRAHCFALASFAEGIPVVLMEAMAMGLPCVTTRITGVPELIRDGIDGLLVYPSDAEGLAEALGSLVDDPVLCRRLAANARASVVAHYDLARNTARLGTIFERRVGATARTTTAAATLAGDLA